MGSNLRLGSRLKWSAIGAVGLAAAGIVVSRAVRSVRATADERFRALPGDNLLPERLGMLTLTHAITIRRPPHDVWAWIAQMGAGSRAGWYSYDFLDNRRHRSATRIVPELQHLENGMVFPALPGVTDSFTLAAFELDRFLILDSKAPDGTRLVTWAFVLEPTDDGSTRLIVRARGVGGPAARRIIAVVHFIMQRKQLLDIAQRAEWVNGETAFLEAYDAAMKRWPIPYEEMDIPGRFGTTHVVVSGPKEAPPLVLLHGYMATSAMWSPNIGDFSKDYRVYAIDVMGQPSKSIPDEPIRNASDYVEWLTATLDALHLGCIRLLGMSYGGWLALTYAVAAPERVQKLALLSPGGFAPVAKQFSLRGMLMMFFPTRFTVNSFMRWLGFRAAGARPVLDLMYLGLKNVRLPPETLRVMPTVVPDDQLRHMHVPTLLLMGEREVMFDAPAALARARRLIPHVEADLVPQSSHDMCFTQHRLVDARVLDFLKKTKAESEDDAPKRVVA